MNISGLVTDMRKEFQARLDEVMAREIQQLELDEAERAGLEKELPGLVLPALTAKEQSRAKELLTALDNQVSQLAELTVSIGLVSSEYSQTIGQLNTLLNGKQHDVYSRHSKSRLKFALSTIARTIENDISNAVLGFRGIPDKTAILSKLNHYRGI